MKCQNKRTSIYALLILFLSGAAIANANPKQATPVIVVEVRIDRFADRVEALGTLRANESVNLTANVTETVTGIHFEDGQRVAVGQVLVEMTKGEEHALLEEDKSAAAEAERKYDRVRAGAKNGAVSRMMVDQRRRESETAAARLRAIQSRLADRLITAPFAGVVSLRNISVGALIEPGDLITTLDDDSVMKLDFTVPATFLETLKPGIPIIARASAFEGRTFEGQVSGISTRIDPATRSVTARAILPNPDLILKPGLLMSIDLIKNPRNALVIAEEALIPTGRDNYVLIVDQTGEPPVARRRKVVIGARRPGEVEILEGLAAGELVVSHGALRARDGQPVRIVSVDTGDQPLSSLLNPERKGES
ncbi:MAG TPA: efflux RND transporter periplasmic adaptor subunit [Desulfosarcina sp.]|nr:efflux RND transporter periplasmic adaptor subunit [Desulfosarcina sp.]